MPNISVIMPCYLGNYPRAAKNRPEKFIRAIQSVIAQTYTEWELIVIADGCDTAAALLRRFHMELSEELRSKITGYYVTRGKQWAGKPRNTGIEKATGNIICYLDADDQFRPDHLQFIEDGFAANPIAEWVWFDDLHPSGSMWAVNKCNIKHIGHCGTANIAHLRRLPVRWAAAASYATDDWGLIRNLRQYQGSYIGAGGYMVCHYPTKFDI